MTENKKNSEIESLQKKALIGFYNLENFFDTRNDISKDDDEFLPNSEKQWTEKRYWTKVDHIAATLTKLGEKKTPLLVGLAEVENKHVLNDLIHRKKPITDFDYIHFESGDRRGIDVALLYNKKLFFPLIEKRLVVKISTEPGFVTRDILYVKGRLTNGERLHAFVNHWPSRREGAKKSNPRRIAAAFTIKNQLKRIYKHEENPKIIIMGDFNDLPISPSISKVLKGRKHPTIKKYEFYNLAYAPYIQKRGTHHSRYGWSMFDQILISRPLISGEGIISTSKNCHIFEDKSILFYDKKYGIYRPNRTYRGNKYHGGYSDHLPIYFNVKF